MAEQAFDLQTYMAGGVERIVKDALRATLSNPRESAFMARFAAASRKASRKRAEEERKGLHVPAFLIASITSACNLHCEGCYSRANHATEDTAPQRQLTSEEWLRIFEEADEMGVSFILLAGGEPTMRYDIIEAAGKRKDILFPVFTNGLILGEKYFDLFDRCRNLLPVISIEGGENSTDRRRGEGVYDRLAGIMDELCRRGLIYGASVTVTKENIRDISADAFIGTLREKGCRAVFFIEYVPVTEESRDLAPDDADRAHMDREITRLRQQYPDMVFISFPGDEKAAGGCVAAGRGFFHINSHGGAEPCPFSPYSDINVRDASLKEALASPLFQAIRENEMLKEEHRGGCVLFEKREQVEALLLRKKQFSNGAAEGIIDRNKTL